jgi:hypothetical protein
MRGMWILLGDAVIISQRKPGVSSIAILLLLHRGEDQLYLFIGLQEDT